MATPFNPDPTRVEFPIQAVPHDKLPTGISVKKGNIRISQGSSASSQVLNIEQDSPDATLIFERFWIGRDASVKIVRKVPDSITYIYQTSGEPAFLLGSLIINEGKGCIIFAPYEIHQAEGKLPKGIGLFRGVFREDPIYRPRNFTFEADRHYTNAASHILDTHLKDWQVQVHEGKGSEPDPVEVRSRLNPVRDQEDVGAGDKSASMLLGESGKPPSSAEEQTARARELYKAGKFKEARNYFRLAAEQGHIGAQNNYASMLLDGEGGPINHAEAMHYLEMVAEHGNAEELNFCACTLYEAGELKEARNCFKLAADKEHAHAAVAYAEMAYEGEGGSHDPSQALVYIKRALQKGRADAGLLYSKMLLKGEDGPVNPTEARRYVKIAALADEDNVPAQELYALILMRGEGGPADPTEAQRRFKMGAERVQLGINEGKVSMKQLKEYADKGSVLAQEAYARILMSTDLKEARSYCKMAVDQGYEPAKELLAIILKALSEKR